MHAAMSIVHELKASGESLSPAIRAALGSLEARVRQLEPLEPLVEQLQLRIRDLEARLGMDSRNSSKPPSSRNHSRAPPPLRNRRRPSSMVAGSR
jgi:hypothetical protein